ncbi:MAG: nucleotide exchange factor GrpE [Gammaproteobacteria bacterium]|nr:nucleotide exchange factor GrpE [Gammaproteobacteria bacterium]
MSDKDLDGQPQDVELQETPVVEKDITPELADDGVIVDSMEQRIIELELALAKSEEKVAAQQDGVLRGRADIENMRRRVSIDVEKAHKFALNKFASELLPVVDNLDRALSSIDKDNEEFKSIIEGIEMTLNSFTTALDKSGVKQINPVGEIFNPELHQAMTMIEVPGAEPNSVIDCMQKGYELNGRLLRPAMVVVAKPAPLDTKA